MTPDPNLNTSFDHMLRTSYTPELPYGFAERVARAVMEQARVSFWSIVLGWTPQATFAVGAAAIALFVIGMTGDGANLFDSVKNYASLSNIFQVP